MCKHQGQDRRCPRLITPAGSAGSGRTQPHTGAQDHRRRLVQRRSGPAAPAVRAARASSSPAGPPTRTACCGCSSSVRSARATLCPSTSAFARRRRACHSAGLWARSNGSSPAGPGATSDPTSSELAAVSRNTRPPSSASSSCGPSSRLQGPRLAHSAADRLVASSAATTAVSRSPAPAATTSSRPEMTSTVPPPRSSTAASVRAPGVARAPDRAAAPSQQRGGRVERGRRSLRPAGRHPIGGQYDHAAGRGDSGEHCFGGGVADI